MPLSREHVEKFLSTVQVGDLLRFETTLKSSTYKDKTFVCVEGILDDCAVGVKVRNVDNYSEHYGLRLDYCISSMSMLELLKPRNLKGVLRYIKNKA